MTESEKLSGKEIIFGLEDHLVSLYVSLLLHFWTDDGGRNGGRRADGQAKMCDKKVSNKLIPKWTKNKTMNTRRAVDVAQWVERSLPIPEVRGSNPFIGKFYLLSTVLKKKIKKKEAGNCPFNTKNN